MIAFARDMDILNVSILKIKIDFEPIHYQDKKLVLKTVYQ